jgi:hypothetical protein
MLISKKIIMRWNRGNIKYYTLLGYKFTKDKGEFEINIKHLSTNSHFKVEVLCDYCKENVSLKPYSAYHKTNTNAVIKKDCCNNTECMKIKRKESLLATYGVPNVIFIKGTKEKMYNTSLKNNGYEYIFKVKKFLGENNPHWKGGVTPEKELARSCWDYVQWRKNIFKRDNYTCQCCGVPHKNIEAHHIKNFSEHIELRYNIDNGITLCDKCHNPNKKGSFHNIHGMKNNNLEQLTKYMEQYKNNKPKEVN